MLGGVVDDHGASVLAERLLSLGPEDVAAFCTQMADKVRRLAELPIEGLSVPDISDGPNPPPPLVGDARDNLLYAIVAAGKTDYESVVSDFSTVTRRVWNAGEAELLISTVADTLWSRTGRDWFDEMDPLRVSSIPADRWYDTYRGSASKSMPRHYLNAAFELDHKLNQSEEWVAWWRKSSLQKVEVSITVNSRRSWNRVERGETVAKAFFEMDPSYFGSRNAVALRALAVEETSCVIETIARELGMPTPPALPSL